MVLDTDKNIWDMIELAIQVICILVVLMLICKTKHREAVRLVRSSLSEDFKEEWRKPVYHFGIKDKGIKDFFKKERIDFNQDDWDVSCEIVDRILKIVACEMRKAANKRFPGLVLSGTLKKQGSSREGLKVCDPLEFDVLLPFHLENVQTRNDVVFDRYGCIIPGLFKMEIINPEKLPLWWRKCELLSCVQEKVYINTSHFQKKVFASLLDQIRGDINKRLKIWTENSINKQFKMVRQVNSPNLKLKLKIRSQNGLIDFKNGLYLLEQQCSLHSLNVNQIDLEIDLVPSILQSAEQFPSTLLNEKGSIPCERYGVLKWVNKRNDHIPKENGDLIWRSSTCGYEKCIFDIAQKNPSQLYVMTACRLLKWALQNVANNQLGSVIGSYHLKNLCMYCILFLTIPSEQNRLSGVTEAMGYFIEFIRISLEAKYLPYFFFGNPYLHDMIPGCTFGTERATYNMFAKNSATTLIHARLGFMKLTRKLHGLYMKRGQLDKKKIKLFAGLLRRQ